MSIAKAGTIAVVVLVAALLAALAALVVAGDPTDDVATEALTPTSTTSTSVGVGRTLTESSSSTVTTMPERRWTTSSRPLRAGDVWTLDTAPTSTTAASAPTVASGPEPIRIPRPQCADGLAAVVPVTAPFTGRAADIPSGLPAVVVKVSNNNARSRAALIGLDAADIVFEERIEASATRFAAVFHSALPPNVGPVRSGRTTDIGILRNLDTPVLGYSGSNNGVAAQFSTAASNGWFVPVINTDRAPFARDGRYSAPDNLFVDPTSLGACGGGGTPSAIFSYGSPTSTTAEPATRVSLDARSPYRFDWSPSDQRWVRHQDGTVHLTRTGAALAPANVVVLFVRYVPSTIDKSSVDAETIGSGDAWILRDGTITVGSWSRPTASAAYALADGTGTAVTLAPGSTWVVLAPGGSASWG